MFRRGNATAGAQPDSDGKAQHREWNVEDLNAKDDAHHHAHNQGHGQDAQVDREGHGEQFMQVEVHRDQMDRRKVWKKNGAGDGHGDSE